MKIYKKKNEKKTDNNQTLPVRAHTWPVNMFNNGSKKISIFFF